MYFISIDCVVNTRKAGDYLGLIWIFYLRPKNFQRDPNISRALRGVTNSLFWSYTYTE